VLTIRMQRTGRSGHAQFRVIVQDSRFSPTRGRVVSYLGSYDPHTKAAVIDSEKAAKYLSNGAQPSDSVARLFKKEGIKMPGWVSVSEPRKRDVRNPDKRRSTAPAQPEAEAQPPAAEAVASAAEPEAPAETPAEDTPAPEQPAEDSTPAEPEDKQPAAEEPSAEEPATEEPAESEEPAAEAPKEES
jgi:small subunit ribosomal protein S16